MNGCTDKLVYNRNTSSMIKHIKSKHSIIYGQYECKSQDDQPTLTSENFKLKELSAEKINQITSSIANFISIDMRPLRIVEGEGFQEMLRTIEPRYKIPPRQTFSSKYIPEHYKEMKASLKRRMQDIIGYSIAFDYWTSFSAKSFLTLTIHYMSDDF